MMKQAFAIFSILWSSTTLFGQTMHTLSAQDSGQGWQLLFDGNTLAGWHVSAPTEGGGRTGPAQPPQPGQVGTPKPCVAARAEHAGGRFSLGSRRWIVTPCGRPTGYLTSDRSYKNFVLSIEFKVRAIPHRLPEHQDSFTALSFV